MHSRARAAAASAGNSLTGPGREPRRSRPALHPLALADKQRALWARSVGLPCFTHTNTTLARYSPSHVSIARPPNNTLTFRLHKGAMYKTYGTKRCYQTEA